MRFKLASRPESVNMSITPKLPVSSTLNSNNHKYISDGVQPQCQSQPLP